MVAGGKRIVDSMPLTEIWQRKMDRIRLREAGDERFEQRRRQKYENLLEQIAE